ncbi:CDP-alcohol phosphatidyltransferase family protein [Patescibacteria group bacterium]
MNLINAQDKSHILLYHVIKQKEMNIKKPNTEGLFTIPNLLSYSRVIFLPLVFVFFYQEMYWLFLPTFVILGLTDTLDGTIARHTNQTSKRGEDIDSAADMIYGMATLWFIFSLYPDLLSRISWELVVVLALVFAATVVIGLVKFNRLKFMHTWLHKAGATGVYFILVMSFFMDIDILVNINICLVILAFIEDIIIYFKYGDVDADVKSIFSLIKKPL